MATNKKSSNTEEKVTASSPSFKKLAAKSDIASKSINPTKPNERTKEAPKQSSENAKQAVPKTELKVKTNASSPTSKTPPSSPKHSISSVMASMKKAAAWSEIATVSINVPHVARIIWLATKQKWSALDQLLDKLFLDDGPKVDLNIDPDILGVCMNLSLLLRMKGALDMWGVGCCLKTLLPLRSTFCTCDKCF